MAQSQVNSDAIAAELRDSQAAQAAQAAHRKIQKLIKNLKSEFEVPKVGLQPNEQHIQLQQGPKPFLEWLGEMEHYNIEKYYAFEQRLRRESNLEMEGFSIWYRKHIIEMSQLKKLYECEQANHSIQPTSPQKMDNQEHAWEIESPQFLQRQSSSKKKPFVWK